MHPHPSISVQAYTAEDAAFQALQQAHREIQEGKFSEEGVKQALKNLIVNKVEPDPNSEEDLDASGHKFHMTPNVVFDRHNPSRIGVSHYVRVNQWHGYYDRPQF